MENGNIVDKYIPKWVFCGDGVETINGKNVLNFEQFYAALYMEMVQSDEWVSRDVLNPVVSFDKLFTKFIYEFCYENQNGVWVLRSCLNPFVEEIAESVKDGNGFVNTLDFLGVLKSNVIFYNSERNLKDLGFGGIFAFVVRKYRGVYQTCDRSDCASIRELNTRGMYCNLRKGIV